MAAGSGRLDGGNPCTRRSTSKWPAALRSIFGGPGKDFNGISGIGPAMTARIAWSAA